MFIATLAVAILSVGCISHGEATFQGRNTAGRYSANGDNAMVLADKQADFEERSTYAQVHADCMQGGNCPYYMGGLGTDLEFDYANVGRVGGTQQPASGGANVQAPNDDALCAREMAEDLIRIKKAEQKGIEPQLHGAPHCKKGGAQ
jgi:hypothetical protein